MANKTKYAGDIEFIYWSFIQSSSFLDLVIKECRLTRASTKPYFVRTWKENSVSHCFGDNVRRREHL